MALHGDCPSSIPSSAPPLQTVPEETGEVMVMVVREGGGGWVRDEGGGGEVKRGRRR